MPGNIEIPLDLAKVRILKSDLSGQGNCYFGYFRKPLCVQENYFPVRDRSVLLFNRDRVVGSTQ